MKKISIGCIGLITLFLTGCGTKVPQELVDQTITDRDSDQISLEQINISVNKIPDDQLYYQLGSEKIKLVKQMSKGAPIFIPQDQTTCQLSITDQLMIQFNRDISVDKRRQIIDQLKLVFVKAADYDVDNYLVKLTNNSNLQNPIEMCHYLKNNFSEIDYCLPDFERHTN